MGSCSLTSGQAATQDGQGPKWGRVLRGAAADVQGLLQAYGHQQGWPAGQERPAWSLRQRRCTHIVVGTPGRILALVKKKKLVLKNLKHFVLDECDRMLDTLDMRKDVQEIFRATPHEKQVMMFTATLNKEVRPVCKKFMQDPMEVFIDDESKLTLHGLQQHYAKIQEKEKNRKLFELLDA